MSYDTNKNWFYELNGRFVKLWQYVESAATDTVGSYNVRLPDEYYGHQLIYPDEDITNGLRVEYTSLYEPFISEALETTTGRYSGSDILFTASSNYIRVATSDAFQSAGFVVGDKIRVIGSGSNDGDYTISAIGDAADTGVTYSRITTSESVTTEAVGESITIYQIPKSVADSSVDESSHVNLNNMLTLAVIDYLKAQLKDSQGDVQLKEYYMREFWKKIGDNESNKRSISVSFPASPFALK